MPTTPMVPIPTRDVASNAVLVVDDDDAKRIALRSILRPLGGTVVEAASGRAALRCVMKQDFAVILLDVRMPTMDGFETARLIRQRIQSESTPIIFVTGLGRDEVHADDGYGMGAVDFMTAPIIPGVLRAKVAVFIDLFTKSRALQDVEARTRTMLDNLADGIVAVGHGGVITSLNRSACRMFGYTEPELTGKPLRVLVAPEMVGGSVADAVAGWDPICVEDGFLAPIERVGRRSDGSTFPMETEMNQVALADGTLYVCSVRDITERRHAETIRYAAMALAHATTVAEAGDLVLESIGVALGSQVAVMWLISPDGLSLHCASYWQAAEVDVPTFHRATVDARPARGDGVPGRTWAHERSLTHDFAMHTGSPREIAAREAGLRTAVSVPIRSGSSVYGVLEFLSFGVGARPRKWDEMADSMGAQLGQFMHDKRSEAELRSSDARYRDSEALNRAVIENAADGIVTAGADGLITSFNRAATSLFGYSEAQAVGMPLRLIRALGDEDLDDLNDWTWQAELGDAAVQHAQTVTIGARQDGSTFPMELGLSNMKLGARQCVVAVIRDVTERLALQRDIQHQAFHDSLTDLPNRALFADRLDHARKRLSRTSSRYAVLILDLDNFKTVNDSLGHRAGDELLLAVSRRLAEAVRPGDTAARLGGDEFGILLEDLADATAAITVADRLLSALRMPFLIGGKSLAISATIGIAASEDAGEASVDVVRNADIALYAGKSSGKARYAVFSDDMHTALVDRLNIEQELRDGIDRGELELRYQPQVDSLTGRVLGGEALVRWRHPTRGLLAPDSFIPMAEETDLITEIDAWVLAEACRQASAWARSRSGSLTVAVNVSGRNFETGALLTRVRRVLKKTGLDPRLLELELTEKTAVHQQEASLSTLRKVRALGVRIAIDDFGTGYSMLSRLQDFPVDILKIDGSFMSKITGPLVDAPIVAATVAMGRGLGLTVVAEGVETEAQRTYLARHGCDVLQGYLISRPVELDEFLRIAGDLRSG